MSTWQPPKAKCEYWMCSWIKTLKFIIWVNLDLVFCWQPAEDNCKKNKSQSAVTWECVMYRHFLGGWYTGIWYSGQLMCCILQGISYAYSIFLFPLVNVFRCDGLYQLKEGISHRCPWPGGYSLKRYLLCCWLQPYPTHCLCSSSLQFSEVVFPWLQKPPAILGFALAVWVSDIWAVLSLKRYVGKGIAFVSADTAACEGQ